jgi:predicted PolB exonuclease-like 3'-5' exonuclease
MHCFSFDIETVPDVDFGRRMWGLEGLPDDEVATAMTFMRQQQTGSDFLPLHQHRVVAISVALRTGDSFKVWSLGDEESGEAEIVGRFFYQHRGRASLDQTAVLLGFPGKLGMSGDKVWEKWLAGGIREIRDYCETDVLNTWLIYLRFEFMRGNLDTPGLEREFALVRETLAGMKAPHLDEFLDAWPQPG